MTPTENEAAQTTRAAPLEMSAEEFREAGHKLVDRIAEFMAAMPAGPVTPGETPTQVRAALDWRKGLPNTAEGNPSALLDDAARLLFEHSLFNGHPRFFGFITSSAAPIGALADMLAASVNPNVGGWVLSPMAAEIEGQTVRWIAELIGYPANCGGLLVSGGNMANFVGFLAGRKAKTPWDVRTQGTAPAHGRKMRVYTSAETHTWVQKAADLFGLGSDSIRWIPVDEHLRMRTDSLRAQLDEDIAAGDIPLMVVGTAGSVSTGAVDPLPELAAICRQYDLWFHVDGAYGGFAAALPDAPPDLKGLSLADSVAIDPHKWLYAPLEAGCTLVRDAKALHEAFHYHPVYYHLGEYEEPGINYHEYGMQNSRGFRALKVWLALRQVGRQGYIQMLQDDIELTQRMHEFVLQEPELEAFTHDLSICTFRFAPPDLRSGHTRDEDYLNKLNTALVTRLQASGEAFVSNAVIGGKFLMRACIVNFRTSLEDVRALPKIVVRHGRELDTAMRGEL